MLLRLPSAVKAVLHLHVCAGWLRECGGCLIEGITGLIRLIRLFLDASENSFEESPIRAKILFERTKHTGTR